MNSRGKTDISLLVMASVVSAALGAALMLAATLVWDTAQSGTLGASRPAGSDSGGPTDPTEGVAAAELERLKAELDRVRSEYAALRSSVGGPQAGEATTSSGDELAPGGDVTAPADAKESPPPLDPYEVLALLTTASQEGKKGAVWGHAKQLFGLLKGDTSTAVAALIETLGQHPDAALLATLGNLLSRKDLPLDAEQAASLRDALYQAALDAEDPADVRAALNTMQRLLNNHEVPGSKLADAQVIALSALVSEPSTDPGVRREAMRVVNALSRGHLAFAGALHGVLASDADSHLRAQALQGLRRQQPEEAASVLLALLQRDADSVVLWEAARPASFLTFSSGSIGEFKQAYRNLLHREIDDRARGQAAQSLALIATLDGDSEVPAELMYLAGSTSDAALAEFARYAARELQEGTATIATLAEAWQRWHRTIDREEYP